MAIDPDDLEKISRAVRAQVRDELRRYLGVDATDVELAKKWQGGKVEIWPREEGLEAKEVPIDAFFHKIVMVRDKLRLLEAKLNGHAKLSDAEKVEFQQYITRCYGSLTTFNVLFKDREDAFHGGGKED